MHRIAGRFVRNGNLLQLGHPRIPRYLINPRQFHEGVVRGRDFPKFLEPNLQELDAKWRALWKEFDLEKAEQKTSKSAKDGKDGTPKKTYVLPMFPYPSGDLHLGHLRVYTISDVLARFRRMNGEDVIHPIGWDAFGLPAENAAIERGIDPAKWTSSNISKMKEQLEQMNGKWDWDREFATCDPSFYKHTQRLFLLLHERGLAYQAKSMVNYDPVDKTVLANEQVDAKGHSWRSGAKVEKKLLKQWFFKISEYRQELLDGLDHLAKNNAWPERVLAMQRNWLGKSLGARVKFKTLSFDKQPYPAIKVFTTRPDTLFGVQYIALASTHPIVLKLAKENSELAAFIGTFSSLPPESKVGYLLHNVRATNPLAYEDSSPDATKTSLPIYVAPYVLGDYGDGAVMGVPGHDTRDHAFWKANKPNEPVRLVVGPSQNSTPGTSGDQPYLPRGVLTSSCGPYSGLSSKDASARIVEVLMSKKLGSPSETWRLRDWLVSRQRYWGTPIPIIHCDSCGAVPVPVDQLPVKLPVLESHWTKGKTGNPLEHAHDWINTSCPKCGGEAKRDTDTMDTFVDSSWYFMRFPDSKNIDLPFSSKSADDWLPVDLYIGGVEHAILHLLYARFISKFLATTTLWPKGLKTDALGEPFKRVLTQGMVHGKTYSDPVTGRFLKPNEVYLTEPSKPMVTVTGQVATVSYEKMSKSKYNGVDPSTCIEKYGADATRAHILFQAPVSDILEWDEEKISGVTRWLQKLWTYVLINKDEFGVVPTDLPDRSPAMYIFLSDESSRENEKLTGMPQPNHRDPTRNTNEMMKCSSEAHRMEEIRFWRSVQATIISTTKSYHEGHSLNTVVSDLMALTNAIIEYSSKDRNNPRVNFLSALAVDILLKLMAPITPAFSEECSSILREARYWNALEEKKKMMNMIVPRNFEFAIKIYKLKVWWAGDVILPLYKMLNWPINYNLEKLTAAKMPTMDNKHDEYIEALDQMINKPHRSIFDTVFPTPDGLYDLLAPSTQTCAVQVNGKLKCAVEIPLLPEGLTGLELQTWITKEILETELGKEKLMGEKVDVRKASKAYVARKGKTVNFIVK